MKLAIMQPYFFPYIGYFSLIKHTDEFILLDTVQHIRHGWIDRNRILKQGGGWQYIRPALIKPSRDTLIKDVQLDNTKNWEEKILAQLQHYRKDAPHYFPTIKLLENIFAEDYKSLTDFNYISLVKISEYLGVNAKIDVFSKMNLKIETPNAADEWALNICKAVDGVSEYWNPIGGTSFFDRNKYTNNNIDIHFQEMQITEYKQQTGEFEGGLSIIDVLMFKSVEEINTMLDQFKLI